MPLKKRVKRNVVEGKGEASDSSEWKKIKIDPKGSELLKKAYGISFPDDLYMLWNFCSEVDKREPLKALSSVGLRLVGPFEVLSKEISAEVSNPMDYHLHWRFYYDPPELMTLMVSTKSSEDTFHIGYLRDDPKDEACIAVSNNGQDCKITTHGDNLFCAVYYHLSEKLSSAKGKEKLCLQNLSKKFCSFAKTNEINLEAREYVKKRQKNIVDVTFHGAGIVVPIDENDVGYRPVGETPVKLKRMFKNIDNAENDEIRMEAFDVLQDIITYVQLANDECDFGMGLELGINMFCYGSRYLNKAANRMLSMAYNLLKRNLYQRIIEHHLSDRRKENYARIIQNG